MSILERRKERVARLIQIALKDKLPHKYIQGQFLLGEIEKRIRSNAEVKNNGIIYFQQKMRESRA